METPVNDTNASLDSNDAVIEGNAAALDDSTPLDTPIGDEVPGEPSTAADGEVSLEETPVIQAMSYDDLVADHLKLRSEVMDMARGLAQLSMGVSQMHQGMQAQLGGLAQGLDTYQATLSQLSADVAETTGKPNALFSKIQVILTDGPINNNSVKLTLHSDTHPTHPDKLEAFNLNTSDPDQANWFWTPTDLKPELVQMTIDQYIKMGRERDKFCCATFQLGAAPQLPTVPEAANDDTASDTTPALEAIPDVPAVTDEATPVTGDDSPSAA